MNYTSTYERQVLHERLREHEAMRSHDIPREVSAGGTTLVSVSLALTLASIGIFVATMLTQDFTGKYRGYDRPMASIERGVPRAIPKLSGD